MSDKFLTQSGLEHFLSKCKDTFSAKTHTHDYIESTMKGAANGVASLDSNGLVPSSQLPSYVDDVLEYSAKSSFPSSGETGKIYVDTSTNLTYRWSGSAYVEISKSLALGETSSTAYAGDKGATLATNLSSHTGNTTVHITSTERTAWNGKYAKPSGGIPKTDLASDVQTSLGKADTALQGISASTTGSGNAVTSVTASGNSITVTKDTTFLTEHQDISGKEDKSNKVSAWSATTTDDHYPSEKLVKTALDTHTHNYAGSSSAGGSANSAEKVASTLSNTTKAYLVGSSSSSTSTDTLIKDSNVYLDSTAGKLVATTFEGNLTSNVTNTKFINLAGTVPAYKLGDTGLGGGVVFYDAGKTVTSKYLNADGNEVSYNWRYLEVSPRLTATMPDGSTATTHPWGVNWNSSSGWLWEDSAVEGLKAEIGTGRYNTTKAVNQLGTDFNSHYYSSSMSADYVTGPGNYAPCICYNYRGGGFSDWYLPSIQELVKIYTNAQVPGYINENSWCWSSSVYSSDGCWYLYFSVPYVYYYSRCGRGYVRAVRGFLP